MVRNGAFWSSDVNWSLPTISSGLMSQWVLYSCSGYWWLMTTVNWGSAWLVADKWWFSMIWVTIEETTVISWELVCINIGHVFFRKLVDHGICSLMLHVRAGSGASSVSNNSHQKWIMAQNFIVHHRAYLVWQLTMLCTDGVWLRCPDGSNNCQLLHG